MADEKPLLFVVVVGSLRKGSYNAAIARALLALAPAGVTISALPRSANFLSTAPTCRRRAFLRWRRGRRNPFERRTAWSS